MTDMENLKSPLKNDVQSSNRRKKASSSKSVRKLEKRISELMEEKTEERERLLRRMADLDNLMKAKDREMSATVKMANRSLLISMLPFLDSMDSAIASHPNESGLVSLRDQFLKILKGFGLMPIEAGGKEYNPYEHEAVALTDKGEDGKVVDELQKGYKLNDEVIRTSKVTVSKR